MKITEVIDELLVGSTGPSISVREILQVFGSRSYAAVLLILGLLALFPLIGGLPGVPLILSLLIILFSVQLTALKTYPWVPARLAKTAISREKVVVVAKKSKPWLIRLERYLRPRLQFIATPPGVAVVGLACFGLALTFIPLSFVPFGVALPAVVIIVLGAGLLAQDGAVLFLGLSLTVAVGLFLQWLWPF